MQKIIFLLTLTVMSPIFGADELKSLLKPKPVLGLWQICLPIDVRFKVSLDTATTVETLTYEGKVDWTRGENSLFAKMRISDIIATTGRFVNHSEFSMGVVFKNGSVINIDDYAKELIVRKNFYTIDHVFFIPRSR